jgi:hypothetical protein
MIPAGDFADLPAAFHANLKDLGVGLYNPSADEVRLGSFDTVAQRQGHKGLADARAILPLDSPALQLAAISKIPWRAHHSRPEPRCSLSGRAVL